MMRRRLGYHLSFSFVFRVRLIQRERRGGGVGLYTYVLFYRLGRRRRNVHLAFYFFLFFGGSSAWLIGWLVGLCGCFFAPLFFGLFRGGGGKVDGDRRDFGLLFVAGCFACWMVESFHSLMTGVALFFACICFVSCFFFFLSFFSVHVEKNQRYLS